MNESDNKRPGEGGRPAQPPAAHAPEQRAAGRCRPSSGALPSNTAPSSCINSDGTHILRNGIDSLYLSYPGQLSEASHVVLDALKRTARSKDEVVAALAQHEAGDQMFEVKDRGYHPYSYLLRNSSFALKVAGFSAARVPLVHAQLSSFALTSLGPICLEENLRQVVASLGTLDGEARVSRIDLCVDFVTNYPLDQVEDRDWVSRARGTSRHNDKRAFTGYTIGAGGKLSARLYNKTLEIEIRSNKTYMYRMWQAMGWDGISPVWRLEFQFRREVLHELGLKIFPHVINGLGGLWAYATHEWLRLTCPSPNDKTQSRWPTHTLWAVLQDVDWGTPTTYSREPVDQGSPPRNRTLFVNGLSGITSYMAREGITDPPEGVKAFWQAARRFHDDREYLTGVTFDEYVMKKVAAKAKAFNTMKNPPPDGRLHPADQALAAEYRKRSDGY